MSFQALESPGIDDDKMWLTYWCVFGVFAVFDQFTNVIFNLLPFYFIVKLIIVIYLFHPAMQGSLTLYNNVV